MEGIVFDIQRFALHDGPGIRTTVFLKGCPLHCVWCCNPESVKSSPQLAFIEKNCSMCRNCITACKENVFSFCGENLKTDFSNCNLCGDCIEACDTGALKLFGYRLSADAVIAEVIKDISFYNNSGGGLTLSGGEPLAQPDFAIEILEGAKKYNIHTCVETSGFVNKNLILKTIPFIDMYLFDFKIASESMHQKYTSAGNRMILENLELLIKNGCSLILRCPIVPGINNDDMHFKSIAELSRKYPGLKGVELMPYHNWGIDKYKQIGVEPDFKSGSGTKEDKQVWIKKISSFGGKNIY
jgi:pyruvate formate lyase activating enzyme